MPWNPGEFVPDTSEPSARRKRANGKAPLQLLPFRPLEEVARAFEAGLQKEGRRPGDWKESVRAEGGRQEYTGALLRHAHRFADGHDFDDTTGGTGRRELALVVTNALILLWDDLTRPEAR